MFVLRLLVVVYNELGDFVEPKLHISVNTLYHIYPRTAYQAFVKYVTQTINIVLYQGGLQINQYH